MATVPSHRPLSLLRRSSSWLPPPASAHVHAHHHPLHLSCPHLIFGKLSMLPGDEALRRERVMVKAEDDGGTPAAATVDRTVCESDDLKVEGNASVATKPRKVSPLQRGGTLSGGQAAGKDPSPDTMGHSKPSPTFGYFEDPKWRNGTWDIQQFTDDGKVDWDSVINSEISRRKWLEENPESSSNSNPVVFDTSIVPWWAWMKRFHLPEAEILNGRAAMVGFFAAYAIDSATGIGLVDQTNSFFGKLLLFIVVAGIILIRKKEDLVNLKNLAKEWTFYDQQWQATWKEGEQKPVSESENKL